MDEMILRKILVKSQKGVETIPSEIFEALASLKEMQESIYRRLIGGDPREIELLVGRAEYQNLLPPAKTKALITRLVTKKKWERLFLILMAFNTFHIPIPHQTAKKIIYAIKHDAPTTFKISIAEEVQKNQDNKAGRKAAKRYLKKKEYGWAFRALRGIHALTRGNRRVIINGLINNYLKNNDDLYSLIFALEIALHFCMPIPPKIISAILEDKNSQFGNYGKMLAYAITTRIKPPNKKKILASPGKLSLNFSNGGKGDN